MEKLATYSYHPLPAIKDHIKSVGIKSLKKCARSGTTLAFISDLPIPFLYNTNTENCRDFRLDGVHKSPLTAVDISYDLKFVITGHEDGSVSLWSIPDCKLIKTFPTQSKKEIVFISFGWTPQEFFTGNIEGSVSRMQLRKIMGFYSLSETFLVKGNGIVTNIITMKNGMPFNVVFVSWLTSYMIFNGETLQVAARSQEYKEEISIDHYADDEKVVLTVSTGPDFQLLKFTEPKKFTQICNRRLSSGTIKISEFLASGLFVAITDGGELTIVSFDGKIAQQIKANDLFEYSDSAMMLQPFDDRMIIVQETGCLLVEFLDWKGKIRTLVASKNFQDAFRSLIEIDAGLAKDLVGLPKNPTECRMQLRDMTQYVVINFFNNSLSNKDESCQFKDDNELKEDVATAVANVASLRMTSILGVAAKIFIGVGAGDVFYAGTLHSTMTSVSTLITPEFVREYLELSKERYKLEEAEEELLTTKFDQAYARGLFQLAVDYNLINLQKRLLVEYLDDVVTPCELFMKHERIVEYCKEVFVGTNPVFTKAQRRSVTLWLLYPQNNAFKRLEKLFSSSWEDAPVFACEILKVCPIPMTKDLSKVLALDSILNTIKVFEYSCVVPIIEAILPFYAELDSVTSSAAIKYIINFIISSSNNIEDREKLLKKYMVRYPDLIKPYVLGDICSKNGFVEIALERFLYPKPEDNGYGYSFIVGAYLSNNGKKEGVFDFISAHVDNQAEMRKALDKHISRLLVLDAVQTVRIIWRLFSGNTEDDEEKKARKRKSSSRNNENLTMEYAKTLDKESKFLFLRALDEVAGERGFTQELNNEYFEFLCEREPQNAIHFIRNRIDNDYNDMKSGSALNFDKVLEIAKVYNRIDCQIRILIAQGDLNGDQSGRNKDVFELVSEAIEDKLLQYIDSDDSIQCHSIDDLDNLSEMEPVKIAIDLLTYIKIDFEQKTDVPYTVTSKCQRIFKSFRYPLYKAKDMPTKSETLTLIFSYFSMQTLPIIGSENVFRILDIYFSPLNVIYHTALAQIFERLDYQKMLYDTVEQILITDCTKVIKKAFIKSSSGNETTNPICAICHEPIIKSIKPIKVFPCGHCFHENLKCGHHTYCTICVGGLVDSRKNGASDNAAAIPPLFVLRWIGEFENRLRTNYNESINEIDFPGANRFLCPRKYKDEVTTDVSFHTFFGACPEDSKFTINTLTKQNSQ